MDSRLAADPIARHILEVLALLERAAGVRAHYRILDPPPLSSVDLSSLQTVARVLGDWMGLRNATFNVSLIEHNSSPRLIRIDPDHEEFVMEIPVAAVGTTETALALITRQVSRTYLLCSNIAGSSSEPDRTTGSLADITAIFLGMGKLILNAPAAGNIPLAKSLPDLPENQPLSPEYLAFTHRLVCSMRGLDWSQHTSGMGAQAISYLRSWDSYRDSVFSQALRNVLTASASHRPLMDAVEDNHLALARFDQLQRVFQTTVLTPLETEMERYHQTCKEGVERLNAREQDTYDPCLLYLNQLRRRMDLQRYADMLLVQQDHIINRLRILTGGLSDLNSRKLVHADAAAGKMNRVACPFDGTIITIQEENQDARVKCPTCAYSFLASAGLPHISAMIPPPSDDEPEEIAGEDNNSNDKSKSASNSPSSLTPEDSSEKVKTGKGGLIAIVTGLILLPLSWLPMMGYLFINILRGSETPLLQIFGKVGIWGSLLGLLLIITGLIIKLTKWFSSGSTTPKQKKKIRKAKVSDS